MQKCLNSVLWCNQVYQMKTDKTTIKINRKTKQRLDNLKEHKRETYEETIRKILYILNRIRKDPISANRVLGNIDANIKRKTLFKKDSNQDNKESKLK